MANVELLISTTIRDLNGVAAPQQVYADAVDTVTLAQLVTAVNAYRTALDLVTDGLLEASTVSIEAIDGGTLKFVAGPNPIIANALFTYPKTGQVNRSYSNTVPAWAQSKIAAGKVDTSDTDVQAYYKLWAQNNITNLSSFLSNNWEGLQPAKRIKRNDRSVEREMNRTSTITVVP